MVSVVGDELVFSTGKRVYAFGPTVGLDVDDFSYSPVGYGTDGRISTIVDRGPYSEPEEYLSLAETQELAQFMIERWTAFRDALPALAAARDEELRTWPKRVGPGGAT
jgi:hypothetical protein